MLLLHSVEWQIITLSSSMSMALCEISIYFDFGLITILCEFNHFLKIFKSYFIKQISLIPLRRRLQSEFKKVWGQELNLEEH